MTLETNCHIVESNMRDSFVEMALVKRPAWSEKTNDIKITQLKGGTTNTLYAVHLQNELNTSDTLLFRIYGKKTEEFIDRKSEIESMKLVKIHELGPDAYFKLSNGLCYEYLPGEILTQPMMLNEEIYTLQAKAFAHLHSLEFGEHQPVLFTKLKQLLDLIEDGNSIKTELTTQIEFLESHLTRIASEYNSIVVFCHNDLALANTIYNKSHGSIKFIDFEYAGYNYQPFDVGNLFCEFAGVENLDYSLYPSREYQRKWVKIYLDSFYSRVANSFISNDPVNENQVEAFCDQVEHFVLASHMMWSVWNFLQAQNSDLDYDFTKAARARLHEYYKLKSQLGL